MRWLVFFLFGCGVTAQSPDSTIQKDDEITKLLSKVNSNIEKSVKVQEVADKKQKQIVTETITKIKELKTELNEAKAMLDSVSTDSIVPVKLLPISH